MILCGFRFWSVQSFPILILVMLSGCVKSPSEPASQEPATITLSSHTVVLTSIGQRLLINATVLDQDSKVIADATIFFRSGNVNIATVSDNGLVTAVSMGTTQITISSGYASATATVSVEQEAASLVIEPASATLTKAGETVQFEATVKDTSSNPIPGAAVVWSSSNPEFATVDANGIVTAVSSGTTQITATSGGAHTSRPVFVELAPPPASIVLNISEATLTTIGQTVQLDDLVYDVDGVAIPDAPVVWSSSHPEVASVDETGLVSAISDGTALVTATSGNVSIFATIHVVVEREAVRITVAPASATLTYIGQTVQLEALVYDIEDVDIPGALVEWMSRNPAVATVNENGLVTAVSNGSTQINAMSGGVSTDASIIVEQEAVRVTVTPSSAALTSVGQTFQLEAVVYDMEGAAIPGAPVEWSSGASEVATVDAAGLVTAVSNGSAQIMATSGDASAIARISVMQTAVRIAIIPSSATLTTIGATVQLEAVVYDLEGETIPGAPIAWSNIDPSVATVDATGLVTAVSSGSARITATSGDVSAIAEITVMQAASRIVITPPSATLESIGEAVQLEAVVYDTEDVIIPGAPVEWSSSDPEVAAVDASGLVTAVSNGSAQINATSGDASESAEITVMQAASRIVITPPSATLESIGEAVQLEAVVYDMKDVIIPGAPVEWSSSDPEVAAVDASGLVTAVSNGSAQIMATSGDALATAEITVMQAAASVTITPPSATLRSVGSTVRFEAVVYDMEDVVIPDAMVEWSSNDSGVATVDSTGVARGVRVGETTITATSGDVFGTARLTVTRPPPPPPPPPARPDLTATVMVNLEVTGIGETVRGRATIYNIGDADSPMYSVFYHRSTDPTITPMDLSCGSAGGVPTLPAGESREGGGCTWWPQVAKTVYFGACVSPVPEESDQTNNCSTGVAVTSKRSDLVVQSPSVSKNYLKKQEQFTLSATVKNAGGGRFLLGVYSRHFPMMLRYYRSTDSTISTDDEEMGTDLVDDLPASGTEAHSIDLTAPSSPGTYYYGACMDPALQTPAPLIYASELNTSNNCSGSVELEVEDRADLYVWNIQITQNSVYPGPGDRFQLGVWILNRSRTYESPETTLRWYRSTDATITTSDTEFGTTGVDPLGTSNAVTESIWLTAPTNAGTYYYGACADPIPNEPDTTNNCSESLSVTVTQ